MPIIAHPANKRSSVMVVLTEVQTLVITDGRGPESALSGPKDRVSFFNCDSKSSSNISIVSTLV